MGPADEKRALRQRLRRARAELTADARDAANRLIALRLAALISPGALVGSYAATPYEAAPRLPVPPSQVAYPRVVDGELEFAMCAEGALVPGAFGVLEPPSWYPAVSLDRLSVVLVPGLAFTPGGGRLGQGGGHYDRLLSRLPGGIRTIGIAFDEQLVEALPMEPHDQGVHLVLTPRRAQDAPVV